MIFQDLQILSLTPGLSAGCSGYQNISTGLQPFKEFVRVDKSAYIDWLGK